MINKLKKLDKKYYFIGISLITFILIFILNRYTNLQADDFDNSLLPTGGRIESIKDIVERLIFHYNYLNGRLATHALGMFFLMFNKIMFDIVNTLVFVLFNYLIYLHIKGTKNHSILLYVLINLMTWLFIPAFGETILWLIGSVNYLWGTVLILIFLLPYRFGFEKENNKKIMIPFMMILGFIIGTCNENTSGAAIFMCMLFIIIYYLNHKKLNLWMIIGCISAIIGYIFMFTSPGNSIRIGYFEAQENVSFLIRILKNASYMTTYINDKLLILLIMFTTFIDFNIFKDIKKNIKTIVTNNSMPYIYLLGGLSALFVLILLPAEFPDRATIGVIAFIIIGVGIGLHNIIENKNKKNMLIVLTSLLILLSSINYIFALYNTIRVYNSYQERLAYIEKEKANGNLDIVIDERIMSVSKYVAWMHHSDLKQDKTAWPNGSFASYYGINTIKLK